MERRAISAVRWVLAVATMLMAGTAEATTGVSALIVGAGADRAAYAGLAKKLNRVTYADEAGPGQSAEAIRGFISAPVRDEALRLILVLGDKAQRVCPGHDEPAVRPALPTIILGPACVKLIVRAPTSYETMSATARAEPPSPPSSPPIVFVSLPADGMAPDRVEAALSNQNGLVRSLACADAGRSRVDFAPGMRAWGVEGMTCDDAEHPEKTAASKPPPSPPAPALPPVRPPIRQEEASAGAEKVLSMVSPVDGRIVRPFGAESGGKASKGIEYEVAPGAAVKAAAAGEVAFVGTLPGYGRVIALRHGADWATVYAGTGTEYVAVGQVVGTGDTLAGTDTTTNRLHFQVRRRGAAVDPAALLTAG